MNVSVREELIAFTGGLTRALRRIQFPVAPGGLTVAVCDRMGSRCDDYEAASCCELLDFTQRQPVFVTYLLTAACSIGNSNTETSLERRTVPIYRQCACAALYDSSRQLTAPTTTASLPVLEVFVGVARRHTRGTVNAVVY